MSAIMVPQTFDMATREIELTRPGDPFAWPSEPRVDNLVVVDARENAGGYLRLVVDIHANQHDNDGTDDPRPPMTIPPMSG